MRKDDTWTQKIIPGLLIVFFIGAAIYGIIRSTSLHRNATYTLGHIYRSSTPDKSGRTHYFDYYYKGKRYQGGIKGLLTNRNDSNYIFVYVDSTNPERVEVDQITRPPLCLTFTDVPYNGWTSKPTCR